MNLVLDLPYDVMVGSIVGATILGIVFLITKAVVKVSSNKAAASSSKDW
jgi:hypothetical protein